MPLVELCRVHSINTGIVENIIRDYLSDVEIVAVSYHSIWAVSPDFGCFHLLVIHLAHYSVFRNDYFCDMQRLVYASKGFSCLLVFSLKNYYWRFLRSSFSSVSVQIVIVKSGSSLLNGLAVDMAASQFFTNEFFKKNELFLNRRNSFSSV